jgi:hypothetical protein
VAAMKACPLCLSGNVYASHRARAIERGLLTWIGVLPFRCSDCQTRFYRFAWDDPRRGAHGADPILPVERPRAPRWPVKLQTWVYYEGPGGETVAVEGMTENASLQGAKLRLPEPVPEGSRVQVSVEGGPPMPASVRWSRAEDDEFVHGVGLDQAWGPESVDPRPLRRLRRRRLLRRLLMGLIALGLIALTAWGLVWLMDAFHAYNPKYYEPKDTERERHELQQRLQELSRPPQRPQ